MHAYAFARNAQELDGTYQKVADTYLRVLALLNLPGALVAADAPNPCGGLYRELAVPFPTGESKGLGCEACGYMATEDAARSGAGAPSTEVTLPLEEIQTPGAVTVEQVSQFLGVPAARLVKTIILLSDDLPVAALIRGDQELNESALRKVLGSKELRLADAQTVRQVTGGPIGFSGPVGLRVPLYVDQAVAAASNFVMGANKADTHLVNCNPGRDFNVLRVACIARARPGDKCPACPGELTTCNYMKVGHVSDILSDWSATAGATFLDSDCKTKSLAMGCFSLSPEGVVVATAERFADDSGLCWPTCVAPFQVLVSALNMDEPEVIRTAEEVHAACEAAGIRTLLDDRAESPGVKLKDADLLGIPYQAIVARRSLAQGGVEFRRRGVPDRRLIRATEVASVLRMTLSCGGQEVAHPQPG